MTTFLELQTYSGKTVALVEPDNVESIFLDEDDRLILVTMDGKDYKFDFLERIEK